MARPPPQKPLLVVLGATGTGKSQLAVELALRFNGEIINGDAMQMYHGLPIVTNKIIPAEQHGIPHHLLSIIPLSSTPWRVTQFKRHSLQIISEIRSRGKLPILVGGTHYYTQSLLFKGSSIEWSDEEEVEQDLSREEIVRRWPILTEESEVMWDELKRVDPEMARRWHKRDKRKVQRSLEIYLMTGRRASEVYAEQRRKRGEALEEVDVNNVETEKSEDTLLKDALLFWVHSDKEVLNHRLDRRIGKMIASGLEEEVLFMDQQFHELTKQGQEIDRTRGIWVSIGWKEFGEYLRALKSGTALAEELKELRATAVERTQNATRQYARRQIQWIRHKLIPALAQENASERLYLVDSTDVSKWTENVHDSAISVGDAFLQGFEMQDPAEMSEIARVQLAVKEAASGEALETRECDLCGITLVGEKQWEMHLKSRKHKLTIKSQQKKAGWEKYLKEQAERAEY